MSVAVSPYLPAQQGLFRDQHSDLLDALLDSCQKSSTNPRLPGYGRTLQPYFESEESSPTRPLANSKGQSAVKRTRGKVGIKNVFKPGTASTSGSDEETSFKIRAARSPFGKQSPGCKQSQYSPKAGGCSVQITAASKGEAKGIPWAGPTFGAAPSATDMPMPSGFLLS